MRIFAAGINLYKYMEQLGKILIVDDNEDVLFALNLLLEPYAEKIKVAVSPERIEHFMRTFGPDLILLDMNFSRDVVSGQEGFEALKQILRIDPQAVVIFMTAYSDTDKAVRAIKAGATDFIPKPWEKEKLLATLSSGMKLRRSRCEVNQLKEQVEALSDPAGEGFEGRIIGESEPMRQVFATVEKLREADANILLLGENGTGKDVIARLLYRHSPRYGHPFVTIDLGSIPEQLFESELFGYEKGAFTDARKAKAGRMEAATGGTLFLDEIGNLSLPMQAKLLTAIEKRQIVRLGGTQPTPIDVRLICATNADIHRLVEEGQFRQDLLYRINTIELHIPQGDARPDARSQEQTAEICLAGQRARTAAHHGAGRPAGRQHAAPPGGFPLPVARPARGQAAEGEPDAEPGATGAADHRAGPAPERRQHDPCGGVPGHHPLRPLS